MYRIETSTMKPQFFMRITLILQKNHIELKPVVIVGSKSLPEYRPKIKWLVRIALDKYWSIDGFSVSVQFLNRFKFPLNYIKFHGQFQMK